MDGSFLFDSGTISNRGAYGYLFILSYHKMKALYNSIKR
ncbi:hypothetical protein SAMN05421677_102172 [Halobacillus aidingensis]|nr:hypothetical protein SAMN05421677_102172 [Halobacillus aidingensis]